MGEDASHNSLSINILNNVSHPIPRSLAAHIKLCFVEKGNYFT
jgi:hypothetical protein